MFSNTKHRAASLRYLSFFLTSLGVADEVCVFGCVCFTRCLMLNNIIIMIMIVIIIIIIPMQCL